jgi:hypothetical protein
MIKLAKPVQGVKKIAGLNVRNLTGLIESNTPTRHDILLIFKKAMGRSSENFGTNRDHFPVNIKEVVVGSIIGSNVLRDSVEYTFGGLIKDEELNELGLIIDHDGCVLAEIKPIETHKLQLNQFMAMLNSTGVANMFNNLPLDYLSRISVKRKEVISFQRKVGGSTSSYELNK